MAWPSKDTSPEKSFKSPFNTGITSKSAAKICAAANCANLDAQNTFFPT